MQVRQMRQEDIPAILRIWNQSVAAREVVYKTMNEVYFARKFLESSGYFPALSLVAEEDGAVIGYINGTMKREFLPSQNHENTPGYLTVIFVDAANRGKGAGSALLDALLVAMREAGKKSIACVESNPIELDWTIPGTPGHDHNKAPGVDLDCPGYPFLCKKYFEDVHHEVAMYLDLRNYRIPDTLDSLREKLREESIETGRYAPSTQANFDRMCDRVGSEYWRKVLRDELASSHPRPILAATQDGYFVGFTGPVDKQESGRGWFTGICTDPEFERKGIASVLFNLLMQEFIAVGASFSTLFTGDDNHAQKLYKRTGFDVMRKFAIMKKTL